MRDDDGRVIVRAAEEEALGACVKAVALPYAGHPDYREEWRP